MVNTYKLKMLSRRKAILHSSNEKQRRKEKRLPPEVWTLIFENIDDTYTLSNCTNTSPMMSKLLTKRKTTFLFQSVFQILKNQKYLSSAEDILNCRLVCKAWQSAVLTAFTKPDNWSDFLFHRHHSLQTPSTSSLQLVTSFSSLEDCHTFLLQMGSCKKSPFATNTVQFSPQHFASDEQQIRHYVSFLHLLKNFGNHITHFIYHCPGNDDGIQYHIRPMERTRPLDPLEEQNNTNIVIWLKLILIFMPNLERLEIHRFIRHPSAARNYFPEIPHLSHTPFPNLPRFQYLEMNDDALLPFVKQSLLDVYGSQLARLHCRDGNSWKYNFQFNERNPHQTRFPSLTEVKIDWIMKAENCLRGLISNHIPNLKKLALDFNFVVFPGRVSLTDVLRLLNHFSGTLTDLYLPLHAAFLDPLNNENSPDLWRVTLPNLERFWIASSFMNNPILRKILKKFPALRELHFTDYEAPQRRFGRFPHGRLQLTLFKKEESISAQEFSSHVQGLWDVCPKLQLVDLIRNYPIHERVYSLLKP